MTKPIDSDPRPDLVTRLVREVLPVVGLLAFFGVAVRSAALRLTNDDTFFHLRFGREFLDGWSIRDPGSVTSFGTRDWVPTQWASQVAMAAAEDLGGPAAVAWLAGLGFLTFVLVLYLTARRRATPLVAAVVTAIAFIGASQGLSARPQVISYILVTVTVAAWLATAEDGKLRWWLVPLTWAWANLHGMWSVGIIIGVVATVGIALDARDPKRLRAFLVPAASLVACLLTPVGPALLREVAVVGSRGKYFSEWGPTQFTDPQPLFVAALLALVLLIWFRTGPVSWLHGLLFLLAGAWCLYSVRTVPVGAALFAPVAATALMRLMPGQEPTTVRRDRQIAWAGWGVALVVLALVVPHTLKVGPDLPGWTDEHLSALPAGTVVLNEWEWGGYLMWKHPELDFPISGYGDIYTTDELERNVDLTQVNPEWTSAVMAIDPNFAVLKSDSPLAHALRLSEEWTVLQESDRVVLLESRSINDAS